MDKNKDMQYRYFDSSDCRIVESKEEERTLIFTISDETNDRYKEIMKAKGCQLESYKKNPVVLWAHNRTAELPPIAKALWVKKEKNAVIAKAQFAPTEFATSIYELYKGGFMNGVSVGYIVLEWKDVSEDDDTPANKVIEKWDLLEFSAVPVPANPNALVNASKEMDIPEAVMKDFGTWEEKADEFCNDYFCKAFPCEVKEEKVTTTTEMIDFEEEPESEEKFEDEGKPYPNEHSCRLQDPKKYPKFRRAKCEQKHDGKCIDVIYGITAPKKSDIQALRYAKDVWMESEAKAHCKSRKGKFEPAKKDVEGKIWFMGSDLIELIGEELALKVINDEMGLMEALTEFSKKRKDKNDIDLESIEDEKNVEIELDKIEGSQAGLENSGDEIEITEEEYQKLKADIKKVVSDGFTGEFRKKILGIVDD